MERVSGLQLTDEEFNATLTDIDADLRQESDRIVGREVRGWMKFCEKFRLSMPMDDPLAQRIFEWFNTMYGDRLNVDFDFGATAVDVKGDLYRLRCIHFYGAMYAICSPLLMEKGGHHKTTQGVVRAVVNILDRVQDLTPHLARQLSIDECNRILDVYGRLFLAFSRMQAVADATYIKEAIDDLNVSAESLIGRSPNYGQSNWASLQAVEKLIKSYILQQGATHANIHELAKLFAHAHSLGLPQVDSTIVDAIQCSTSVRYAAALVSKQKSVTAHYAALKVCGEIAPCLRKESRVSGFRRIPAESDIEMVKIRAPEGQMLDALALMFKPPRFSP